MRIGDSVVLLKRCELTLRLVIPFPECTDWNKFKCPERDISAVPTDTLDTQSSDPTTKEIPSVTMQEESKAGKRSEGKDAEYLAGETDDSDGLLSVSFFKASLESSSRHSRRVEEGAGRFGA
ncbi:hypothetical protein KM043_004370 [Ampulex compressa]|nr:hypothetical protein KM043_004370 [Ampulex compressa]